MTGFLRFWLRSGIRGANRSSRELARRFPSLRAVPIHIADWPPVYMDLRDWGAQDWLKGSPWPSSPREEEEQEILRHFIRPGDVVYDIGANIGMHTVLISRLVGGTGQVYAFEPNPALIPALTLTVGGLDNGKLFPLALSSHTGTANLFVAEEDHSLSSLSNWTAGRQKADPVPCQMIPLDDLIAKELLPAPAFIKCDVEGGELDVFVGSRSLLDQPHAPLILFEANVHTAAGFGRSISSARDFLAGLDKPRYRFFELGAGDSGLMEVERMNPVHSNLLAVPAYRMVL